jgi:hypothetical protein
MGAHYIDKFKSSLTTTSTTAGQLLFSLPATSILGIAAKSVVVVTNEVLSIRDGGSSGGYSYRQCLLVYNNSSILVLSDSGVLTQLGSDAVNITFTIAAGTHLYVLITPVVATSTEHVLMCTTALERG